MSQSTKNPQTKEEALEIIELASSDIEVLTRAFNLINEICEERNQQAEATEDKEPEEPLFYLH